MGEIHELLVLALSLVWFAGATPDFRKVTDTVTDLFISLNFWIVIRGVPWQGGTGLDTYQICIQARLDTYQIPFWYIENTEKDP